MQAGRRQLLEFGAEKLFLRGGSKYIVSAYRQPGCLFVTHEGINPETVNRPVIDNIYIF